MGPASNGRWWESTGPHREVRIGKEEKKEEGGEEERKKKRETGREGRMTGYVK